MKFRNWHIVLILCMLIAVLHYEHFLNILQLNYYYFIGLSSGNSASLTFETADYMISGILIILIPLFSVLFRKKPVLNYKPSLSVAVLIILLLLSVLAPISSSFNPEFQRNISVTKLLPPLSSRYFIIPAEEGYDNYPEMRNKVLQNFDSKLQIADAVIPAKGFYQGKKFVPFELSEKKYHIKSVLYILGTDELGRDIYSRLIYGTRISLIVGFLSVLIAFFTGILLGFLSGYYEGWTGGILNRLTDVFLSFPSVFLVILILALFGNSMLTVIAILGFTGWMSLFKIIRGEVKALKSKDFFITASAIGLSKRQLIFKEMLPFVIAPLVNNLVLLFAGVIVAEAALSYLGLGTGVNHPSLGSMIEQGQNYIDSAWWMIIMPGIFLFAAIFSANDIGKKVQSYYNPVRK